MHAVYWILTHPVNKFWLKDHEMAALGTGFFGLGSKTDHGSNAVPRQDGWARYRDRWEYSHVLRAALSAVARVSIIVAVAI